MLQVDYTISVLLDMESERQHELTYELLVLLPTREHYHDNLPDISE